jgi:hypothetical protein
VTGSDNLVPGRKDLGPDNRNTVSVSDHLACGNVDLACGNVDLALGKLGSPAGNRDRSASSIQHRAAQS